MSTILYERQLFKGGYSKQWKKVGTFNNKKNIDKYKKKVEYYRDKQNWEYKIENV